MACPVTEEELAKRLPSGDKPAPQGEVVLPAEISTDGEVDTHVAEEV